MNLSALKTNIRFYILLFSLSLSLIIFGYVQLTSPGDKLNIPKLTQFYALTAISYLYLALLTTPLTTTFTFLPFRGQYLKARRAIGVSAFYFALLHASLAFFGELGGFEGLLFLDSKYLLAISLSFGGLVILALMASTSFDWWVDRLTFPKWKRLHRFVYLAGILITTHALMLGSHFSNLFAIIPQIFSAALAILLLLEAKRLDKFLEKRFFPELQTSTYPRFGIATVIVAVAVGIYLLGPFISPNIVSPLGIHSQHIQIAQQNQTNTTSNSAIPGLAGDKSLRYNVSFTHPEVVSPNTPTDLSFAINFAGNGTPQYLFNFVYSKTMHLIIVSDDLTYFTHTHPQQTEKNIFKITTQFPSSGGYHLYTNFQPSGAIEQQFGFKLNVNGQNLGSKKLEPDYNLIKIFDDIKVQMEPESLSATKLSNGSQTIKFTLSDQNSNQPLTNLKPYLASFGHLVLIETKTFDYLHIHPTNLKAPGENETGGPTVEFMPLGLYGQIKPGTYRVFAQFNPNGKLLVADFLIKIEP